MGDQKMWDLITTGNQWGEINKRILSMVSINADGNTPETHMLTLPRYHPFLVSCTNLPSCNTGFIYLLASLRNAYFTYIGQTKNILQRLLKHNSGSGADGTSRPEDRPFHVAAYICGLSDLTRSERMSLEA